MAEPEEDVNFIPRNYQVELMKIGLENNSIIFLPTGSGKTFIAVMILKRMGVDLISEPKKNSVMLVNTVALVHQHARYLKQHTTFSVGCYTGELNVDSWSAEFWKQEFEKYQVLVMTSQIMCNIAIQKIIDLNRINLMIFDECHRGVSDHSMRQLMKEFENLKEPPRVLGLTATLLNGNCKLNKVMDEVKNLEITYHSKVATVDGLEAVVGFSTNPHEVIKVCDDYTASSLVEQTVVRLLEDLEQNLSKVKLEFKNDVSPSPSLKPLETDSTIKKFVNISVDVRFQLNLFGILGGYFAFSAHMIQIQRLIKGCQDRLSYSVLAYIQTIFIYGKHLLELHMKDCSEKDKVFRYTSDRILQLINIFDEYQSSSEEEMCGILFVNRRFTAKVLYFLIKCLSETNPKYSFLKVNYVVGFNNNPYNNTREGLFIAKKNREVINDFCNKQINLLVASNVMEEGIDIPKCTMVVKVEVPSDYRSYIQSKGRARHRNSYYYIITEQSNAFKFCNRYHEYQAVENVLNKYLIGKNAERNAPTQEDLVDMYNEDDFPPYYTSGPDSAKVTIVSAIPLLNQYVQSLPSDRYTSYSPEWYFDQEVYRESSKYCVVIMLPVVSKILEPIRGPLVKYKKSAKRAAALYACIKLHKAGELNDSLLPRKRTIEDVNVSFLFKHYPKIKEPDAGHNKKRRLHPLKVASALKDQIKPHQEAYLHVINLMPEFSVENKDKNIKVLHSMYKSNICYGLITKNKLPKICDFPIYVSVGTITVSLKVNQKQVVLSEDEIYRLRTFHQTVCDGVLDVLHPFLIFSNEKDIPVMLLAPILHNPLTINFTLIENCCEIKDTTKEPSIKEKQEIEVTEESHLHKIVTPWYRRAMSTYVVTDVCFDKTPLSPFPNDSFKNFVEYFNVKYGLDVVNKNQPLILVKALSKRLNLIKPRSKEHKRKKEQMYEEIEEYLVPEMVVKQDFSAELWVQAAFLPTIFTRIEFLLKLEELRVTIARDTGIGKLNNDKVSPLVLDMNLLNYEPATEEQMAKNVAPVNYDFEMALALPSANSKQIYNKDFTSKKLEAEYPWTTLEEPKDIERVLDVTVMDIEYYDNFVNHSLSNQERRSQSDVSPTNSRSMPAITYHKEYKHVDIELLVHYKSKGPELRHIYEAMTTSKANDIVNLERLETLGDSFLKYISSVYIYNRFPLFDEGQATSLKGRLVSNKNLYYHAVNKEFGGLLRYSDLSPREEWIPPHFSLPQELQRPIEDKELSVKAILDFSFTKEEQISGVLTNTSKCKIADTDCPVDQDNENLYQTFSPFVRKQYVGDKSVADVVEALLGAYFSHGGIKGGLNFLEWMNIIPSSENIENILSSVAQNPVIDPNATVKDVLFHIPQWSECEDRLGYTFRNKAYLLQALTHPSYSPNRVTHSYQRLEFLGDAILDFLVTCHIFEKCGRLDPGQLTDLRSALVNNNTFGSFVVRCGFHKFLLMINSQLQGHIDRFVEYLEMRDYVIDDQVLILLEENDLNMAENIDVPKTLGDIFEALAGAVYLDSGNDLGTVWRVFYKIMFREIDKFSHCVPKNVIRRLYEAKGACPQFGEAVPVDKKTMIALRFMSNGRPKIVHGFGSNKAMAKRAAAKIALRSLD